MEPQAILEFTPLPAKKLLDKMAYFEDTPDTSNEAQAFITLTTVEGLLTKLDKDLTRAK